MKKLKNKKKKKKKLNRSIIMIEKLMLIQNL